MKFFDWAYKNGDGIATSLEYIPLPDAVKAAVRNAWHSRDQGADGKPVMLNLNGRSGSGIWQHSPRAAIRTSNASGHPHARKSAISRVTPSLPAVARFSGAFVLVLLGAIIVVLFLGGLPAFQPRSARCSWSPPTGTRCKEVFRRRGADLRHRRHLGSGADRRGADLPSASRST